MSDDFNPSKMDQAMAMMADSLPPFWSRMYDNLVEAGFDEATALLLLRTYLAASASSSGINLQ